jgi:hypothetical protein
MGVHRQFGIATAATTHDLTVLSLELLLSALGHHNNTTCDTPGTVANFARASSRPTWEYADRLASATAASTHDLTVLSLDILLSALGHHNNTTCDTPGTGPAGGHRKSS